ncbi:MAG: hypothetical protein VKK99_03045, partial [Cyanobacteriota bacterium]|nr:hypothetical protein [Cyanobacteriota bacterium]
NHRFVPGMRPLIKYATSSHQLTKWRATPNLHRSPIAALLSKYVTFICADYGLGLGGIESLAVEFMRHALPPRRMFRPHEINDMKFANQSLHII